MVPSIRRVEPFGACFVVDVMTRSLARFLLLLGALTEACGSAEVSPGRGEPSPDAAKAPTYTELFDAYFAANTPGHCATAGCHADPGHTVWRCGPTKDDCYAGMSEVGLLDSVDPTHSVIIDPHRSPITWINAAGGNMPLDAQGPNATASEALRAWVAAGAQND
jgi:hypothetical protein